MPGMICATVVLANILCAHAAPMMRTKSISVSSNGSMSSSLMRSKSGSSITYLTRSETGSSISAMSGDVIAEEAHVTGWGGPRRRGHVWSRRRTEPSTLLLQNTLAEHFTNCPGAFDNLSGTYEAACDECDWLETSCINAGDVTKECVRTHACLQDKPVGKYLCDNWDTCVGSLPIPTPVPTPSCTDPPGFQLGGDSDGRRRRAPSCNHTFEEEQDHDGRRRRGWSNGGFNNNPEMCNTDSVNENGNKPGDEGVNENGDIAKTACCVCQGLGSSLLQRAGSSFEPSPQQPERSVAEKQDQLLDASLKKKESVDC